MNQNITTSERVLRVTAGLLLIGLALAGPKTIWGLAGIVPLVTGALGFSLVYRALGISTPLPGRRHLHAR